MKTFTFDTTMNAVVTIRAEDEESARGELEAIHDCMQISRDFIGGYNSRSETGVQIVDATLKAGMHEEMKSPDVVHRRVVALCFAAAMEAK